MIPLAKKGSLFWDQILKFVWGHPLIRWFSRYISNPILTAYETLPHLFRKTIHFHPILTAYETLTHFGLTFHKQWDHELTLGIIVRPRNQFIFWVCPHFRSQFATTESGSFSVRDGRVKGGAQSFCDHELTLGIIVRPRKQFIFWKQFIRLDSKSTQCAKTLRIHKAR